MPPSGVAETDIQTVAVAVAAAVERAAADMEADFAVEELKAALALGVVVDGDGDGGDATLVSMAGIVSTAVAAVVERSHCRMELKAGNVMAAPGWEEEHVGNADATDKAATASGAAGLIATAAAAVVVGTTPKDASAAW